MVALSRHVATFSPRKRALIARLFQEKAGALNSFPLSFAQQRLWLVEQWEAHSPRYNIPTAMRLRGPLNLLALEVSLNQIIERHEVLRTIFTTQEDQPIQVVMPVLYLPFPLIDLTELSEAQRERQVEELLRREAGQGFDLKQGPLLRAALLRLSEQEHVLLLTMHHIVSDGWSMGILFQELSTCYEAYVRGEHPSLPDLPIQYADFALWQRQHLQGEVLESQLTYWKRHLQGAPEMLELPTDRPRPPTQSFRGAQCHFELSEALSQNLKNVSQREGVTLFMTLLAGFQVLLSRYSGQKDLLVGTPIANRTRAEIEPLIGFFVNTLVMRANLEGNPRFDDVLKQVCETALGAYAHQDLPFEKLVEELAPQRHLSHSPLFQVVFALQNAPSVPLALPDLTIASLPGEGSVAKFDLTLSMEESEQGLAGILEYNTDLFDAATIERMAGHWQTLLEGIVAHPDARLSALPLLTGHEREQMLVQWNQPLSEAIGEVSNAQCLPQLLEQQAQRTPDAIAVVCDGQQLSYGELNARANQLAHYLQGLGVGPEVLVGVALERSVELVVALLAILKAGGAYVPLDSGYPQERLAFMLQQTQATVLLTQQRLLDRLPQTSSHVLILERDWSAVASQPTGNVVSALRPPNLAYVIYTSGSSGQPKGVQVSQANLLHLLRWHLHAFALSAADRSSQLASLSFDAAVWEMWPPLLAGSTLCLTPPSNRLSPSHLQHWLLEQAISISFVPTPLAEPLLALPWPQQVALRILLVGGDQLHAVASQGLPFVLVNNYGPTEDTVVATSGEVGGQQGAERLPSIGRPISQTQAYVLDRQMQPLPVGVVGELYLGGAGVARGYVGRAEVTGQRFVPDPFSGQAGARLYRTGDLVRWLADGCLEFVGRADKQVKLRGYRIELGEIEAALEQHEGVREALVLLREEGADKRLVAYVLPGGESEVNRGELSRHLREKLPDYMVPSAFVALDAWPLTPNGKLDRQALPAPQDRPDLEAAFVAPGTPVEEILAGIWADILGLERIGIHDNFFELGGHSLLATQVVSRIRTAFQVEWRLRHFFETPTIAALAERIQTAYQAEQGVEIPPVTAASRQGDLPLSFAQQRLWFLEQWEQHSPWYNMPIAIRLRGRLSVAALEKSLNQVIERHEVLRSRFGNVEGKAVQEVAPALRLALPVIDLRDLPQAQRERQMEELLRHEAGQGFDLKQGPLLRMRLLRLSEQEHVLALTMHHIVSDGWSMGIFFGEISRLYQANLDGQPSPLPDLPIQYADFALWQRQHMQGEVLERQLAYWKQQLQGVPEILELPTDRPRPAVQSFRGAQHHFVLSRELTNALKNVSRQQGATLFMTLLAAFQILLSRYSGQRDLVVGTPIANRTRDEIEPLIGFFINTLVMRANLSDNPRFDELLKRVRETALGAYAHQDLPFEKLVEELAPQRLLSHSPLFQVMFALQNAPTQHLALKDVTMQSLKVESGMSRFDLTLSMEESEHCLVGTLEYNTDLFDASTMQRMAKHYQTLLESIVDRPERRCGDLELLTEAEREQALFHWNATTTAYPREMCLQQLFEAQVERTPESIAVVFDDEQLSYHELNARANQLAYYLRELGVGPDVLVGLGVGRSTEMVVALLAILKAGGAYLPLDMNYPVERLAFMLDDARVPLLLTRQSQLNRLPQDASTRPLCLDDPAALRYIRTLPRQNLACRNIPNHLAYVNYTSGSTGQPKGVLIEQRSVTRLVMQSNYVDIRADDIFLQLAPLSFDAATFEIWASLLHGSRLVVFPPQNPDPETLAEVLQSQAISTLWLTSGLFHVMVQQRPQAFEKLRQLLAGGDVLSASDVRGALQAMEAGKVINGYGPTENTTFTACFPMTVASPPGSSVPIGRPIANTQVYVLDQAMQPVPVGVVGELYIGGDGLARGYLNRPQLTAEKFLPHPFSQRPGARLYRTGDLVRWLVNGTLEFLGRRDGQVKVRGFRVELGEIEAVLSQHPAIEEAVALVREDVPGDKRLTAYIVAKAQPVPTSSELRIYLQERLPDYMVPSAFLLLDALPLSPNGKVDRCALPSPNGSRPELNQSYVPPRSASEQVLTEIWADLLGVEQIGVHDNFFELGGDSILSIQIIARARAAGFPLTPRHLFQYQTVAELAAVVDTMLTHEDAQSAQLQQELAFRLDQPWPEFRHLPLDHQPGPGVSTEASARTVTDESTIEGSNYTPADFPEAQLSQEALDYLIAELSETME